ncbi:MAG: hypothetical protein LQ341_006559 [Variospora aurantia]|nr:MAG: hypothetical protein LQ341_006559 [Variospora aurantia]
MGQRHQLFVIARINGRYRQLCAIHHQWLYGHTALRRCRDTLNIFENATNRMPLQQELTIAAKQDDDFWDAADSYRTEKNSHIPFPFIMTCLIVGASFNLDGYFHGVLVEPFYMAYDQGDNNNGITIFDITNLDNVRYCFVDFYGMESKREVDLMTPLSARTYLEAEYELDKVDEEVGLLPLLDTFKGRHLVTTSALSDTWPDGEWQDGPVEEADSPANISSGDGTAATADENPGRIQLKEPAASVQKDKTKSLRDQSMDSLLDLLLDPSQDPSALMAEAEILTDFVPKLRRRLYHQAATLPPSASHLILLEKALQQDLNVDLSPFKLFSVGHLSKLVAKLRNGTMRSVNLSDMPDLTEDDLALILGGHSTSTKQAEGVIASSGNFIKTMGNVASIILLDTPKISVDFVAAHLGHYDVWHSQLLRRPLNTSHRYGEELPALQFSGPNTVSQLVWVGISSMQSCDSKLRMPNGKIDWSDLKYSVEASSRFSGNPGLKYRNYLLDVPLPVAKTAHGLRRLMQYLTSPKLGWFEDWPKAAARCFATTSAVEEGVSSSVGPLSSTFNLDNDRHSDNFVQLGKGMYLKPGQWAIVLIHEAYDAKNQAALDKRELEAVNMFGPRGQEEMKQWPAEDGVRAFKPLKRLRYAFAKALPQSESSNQQRFHITDVPGYVKHVLAETSKDRSAEIERLCAWWEKASLGFGEGTGYYEDDDRAGILQRIYSDEGFDMGSSTKSRPIDPFEDITKMMSLSRTEG